MSKLNFLLAIFMWSIFAHGTQPAQICNSISDCQNVIKLAHIRIQELSTTDSQRVSISGAIFTLVKEDDYFGKLGQGYRDPSAVIWYKTVTHDEQHNPDLKDHPKLMNQHEADKYCKNIGVGGRLPTEEEFVQLSKYLGQGTSQGYYPYLADGTTAFLPGLLLYPSTSYWTSSVERFGENIAYGFRSKDGVLEAQVGDFNLKNNYLSVMCVSKRIY